MGGERVETAGQAQDDPGHRGDEDLYRRSGLLQEYTTTTGRKSGEKEKSYSDQRGTDRIVGAERLLLYRMLGVSSLSSLPSCFCSWFRE